MAGEAERGDGGDLSWPLISSSSLLLLHPRSRPTDAFRPPFPPPPPFSAPLPSDKPIADKGYRLKYVLFFLDFFRIFSWYLPCIRPPSSRSRDPFRLLIYRTYHQPLLDTESFESLSRDFAIDPSSPFDLPLLTLHYINRAS